MDAKALAQVQQQHTRTDRKELLGIVQENRNKHADEYKIALKGWRIAYAEALAKFAAEAIEHGEKVREGVSIKTFDRHGLFDMPPRPEDHTDEYDRIIRRLELSKDSEIFLAHDDFDRYVLDKWKWKDAHTEAVLSYSALARD